jgi:hypothetical protein
MPKRQIFKSRRTACPRAQRRLVLHLRENAAPERRSVEVMLRSARRERNHPGGMIDRRRQCVHDIPIARMAATLNSPSHEIAATF